MHTLDKKNFFKMTVMLVIIAEFFIAGVFCIFAISKSYDFNDVDNNNLYRCTHCRFRFIDNGIVEECPRGNCNETSMQKVETSEHTDGFLFMANVIWFGTLLVIIYCFLKMSIWKEGEDDTA